MIVSFVTNAMGKIFFQNIFLFSLLLTVTACIFQGRNMRIKFHFRIELLLFSPLKPLNSFVCAFFDFYTILKKKYRILLIVFDCSNKCVCIGYVVTFSTEYESHVIIGFFLVTFLVNIFLGLTHIYFRIIHQILV